jgi:aspartate aminotransferase
MISNRAKAIKPSMTFAISAKAKEMKAKGLPVISFGAGEPDFDTPDHIKEAAIKAIKEGFTKYTQTSGILELKQAICNKFKRDNHLEFLPENVLVSTGAKQSLYNIFQILLNPGDRVIIPNPYWVSYEEMVKLAGGVCDFIKTPNFKVTGEDIKKAITKETKALIINSPSNPTGAVYTKEELTDIARVCVEHNIYVVSDEIYESLIYDKTHTSIAELGEDIKKLTIIVNGVSKAYSMTGWRIGYCAGDKEIIKAMAFLQDHSTSNANSIAQKAAVEALNGSQAAVETMRAAYKKRRDYILGRLRQMKNISVETPDGAFYVFVNVSKLYNTTIPDSFEFCTKLLDTKYVAAIPGGAFGDDSYIRLSFATSDDNIEKGMDRLNEFINGIAG